MKAWIILFMAAVMSASAQNLKWQAVMSVPATYMPAGQTLHPDGLGGIVVMNLYWQGDGGDQFTRIHWFDAQGKLVVTNDFSLFQQVKVLRLTASTLDLFVSEQRRESTTTNWVSRFQRVKGTVQRRDRPVEDGEFTPSDSG